MSSERIAIVGMAGRFPGATSVGELWANLRGGVESIRALSDEELARAGVPDEVLRDAAYVKRASDLDGIELFDADFFELPARQAAITDPSQRLLLELAWEAFEDAGHPPGSLRDAVGVFVGASRNDYVDRVLTDRRHLAELGAFAIHIANNRDFLATRLSYTFGLRGPSMTVQTACSTSLVAVHQACQSLLSGECDLALAGGVSIQLPQGTGYLHVVGGVASPDGHCRPFDAGARGTVVGNGGGLVLLRRLEDALADGDAIHAVIAGSAVNNDGASKVGFTAPSVEGQAAVVEEALAIADVPPASIGYVEAHGTATPLGDPIEVAALTEAFRRVGGTGGTGGTGGPGGTGGAGGAGAPGSCALGSIKSNLGHLDAAAGIGGLIKAALCVREGELPPSLHFENPNPELRLERTPFRVVRELEPWPLEGPRRAGVSSFGIGGTNAHVVLEEPPGVEVRAHGSEPQLLVLSARSPEALRASAQRLARRLDEDPALDLADVAWTLQVGRRPFAHRLAVSASDAEEARRGLRAPSASQRAVVPAAIARTAFLFPGQGSQRAGATRTLYERLPVVREELDRCAEALRERADVDLFALLHGADQELLNETAAAQPALFAIEYALARQWAAFGCEPDAMLGHSVGELVAACLAGVMELEDALFLVAERGRLMQAMPRGTMLAVALAEPALAERLVAAGGRLSIASVNGPQQCVAAGAEDDVTRLVAELEREGVACHRLRTSHAFHSPTMEPAAESFARVVGSIALHAPRVRFLSNVTGAWITAEQATDPGYWGAQLASAVRLADGLAELARSDRVLVELGPGRTLAGLVSAPGVGGARGTRVVSTLPARDEDEERFLLEALGRAWTRGASVDWPAVHGREPRRRLSLPTYPFERRRLWVDVVIDEAAPPVEVGPGTAADAKGESVEAVVAETWRELLGLDEVRVHDDFYELGGSSLFAIQVLVRLRELFGVELSMADVLQATTPRELARRVETARAEDGCAAPRSPLVELGRGTQADAVPLVCVPGVDGEVASFAALARELEGERPLVALRAPGLEPGEKPLERVEGLAERYLDALREHRPSGPCELAGHSFGGVVALEMARRLRADGERVVRVVLLDCPLPDPSGSALAVDELRERALETLRGSGLEPSRVGREELERRLAVVSAHERAFAAHEPAGYDGPVLLLLARDGIGAAALADRWERHLGDLEVRTVGGDHFSLLDAAHAAGLKGELSL